MKQTIANILIKTSNCLENRAGSTEKANIQNNEIETFCLKLVAGLCMFLLCNISNHPFRSRFLEAYQL